MFEYKDINDQSSDKSRRYVEISMLRSKRRCIYFEGSCERVCSDPFFPNPVVERLRFLSRFPCLRTY